VLGATLIAAAAGTRQIGSTAKPAAVSLNKVDLLWMIWVHE